MLTKEQIQIRDPYVLADRNEKKYYLYGTTDKNVWEGQATGFDVYVSEDLERWEGPFPAFRPDEDFWADRHYWAPEVYLYDGKYYMFASFKSEDKCRGTQILVSDAPVGPFRLHSDGPVTPGDWECLDGTLYIEEAGQPWMVFCHEWLQVQDGEMCAIPLAKDLRSAAGEPVLLFHASNAPWVVGSEGSNGVKNYVTDGPFLHRAANGELLMLWSSHGANGYAMGVARSASGDIKGPWVQESEPLFGQDGGHGMLFTTFEEELMLTIHRPNKTPDERPLFLPVTEEDGKLSIKREFRNPIIEQRADPWIYKHTDGYYYFTASVPSYDCIELRRARTIRELATAEPVVIWRRHEKGRMSGHIWAPEIHYIDGKWYIYFAAGGSDEFDTEWEIRMYVIESDAENPLESNWVEKGQIQTDWDSFSLDATTFEHRGTRYLVWAQYDLETPASSNLYIAEMSNPWTIRGEQVLITKPEYEWERVKYLVNEGAAVLKKNGKIFISYSASATDWNYCMGLLTASEDSDLLDPKSWTKSPEPVFKSNEETEVYGPGHNSFTVSEDGAADILVYHGRSYKELKVDSLFDPNRHTRVQVLNWNEDGTPNFGIPL